jgi:putative restriction endonuclease
MCGISIGLPEGAHIYPASAPSSPDRIWNGLSLCRNHHRVFDTHRIWVSPDDGAVRWHPELIEIADSDEVVRNFVENTAANLASPRRAVHRPRREMFEQRYDYIGGLYDWAR